MKQTLLSNISELVCVSSGGEKRKRGVAMNELHLIKNAAMLFDTHIHWIGTMEESQRLTLDNVERIDAGGRCVMPGFVDSHTHIVFAGSRSHEFARRLQGVSYQTIAAEGGGILSTVRAVREASLDQLIEQAQNLAESALAYGTTSMEIKSGYALSTTDELKMLRAIKALREVVPLHISATFLGAHDFPPEFAERRDEYVDLICREMIPAVAEEGLAEYCDAFCDVGYYTVEQTEKIFVSAREHGLRLRLHADELGCVHAAELAQRMGADSADHLLFVSDEAVQAFAHCDTVATLLPGTAYTLRLPYAPAKRLIEAGATVALATDCNPGSCFSENMQQMMSLACTNMHMSMEQSICAATLNGAAALGQSDRRGSLEIGKEADFVILHDAHYTDMMYHFGVNHVASTWIGGSKRNPSSAV